MRIDRTTAHLISSGTAICGGSAIAAVARCSTRKMKRCPSAKVAIPWFILFFLIASVIRTYLDGPWGAIVHLARIGLTITLFLIGAALSRQPLVFG